MPRPLLLDLAQKLLAETKSKGITWERTSIKDAFRVKISSRLIQIVEGEDYDTSAPEPQTFYLFDVRDDKDDVIDKLLAYGGENFKLLNALYDEARASALNTDSLLEDILQEVERQGKGKGPRLRWRTESGEGTKAPDDVAEWEEIVSRISRNLDVHLVSTAANTWLVQTAQEPVANKPPIDRQDDVTKALRKAGKPVVDRRP